MWMWEWREEKCVREREKVTREEKKNKSKRPKGQNKKKNKRAQIASSSTFVFRTEMKKNFYFVWFISTEVIHHRCRAKWKQSNWAQSSARPNGTQSIFNLFMHKWHHLNAFTRLRVRCASIDKQQLKRKKGKKNIIKRKTVAEKKISIGCTDHVSNYANMEGSDTSSGFFFLRRHCRRCRVENSGGEAKSGPTPSTAVKMR